MSDNYQVRKDINRLYDELYRNGIFILVPFAEDSDLRKHQTLDRILEYYGLFDANSRLDDLEERVRNLEDDSE